MSDVLESIEELRFYKHNFFGAAAPRGGSSKSTSESERGQQQES